MPRLKEMTVKIVKAESQSKYQDFGYKEITDMNGKIISYWYVEVEEVTRGRKKQRFPAYLYTEQFLEKDMQILLLNSQWIRKTFKSKVGITEKSNLSCKEIDMVFLGKDDVEIAKNRLEHKRKVKEPKQEDKQVVKLKQNILDLKKEIRGFKKEISKTESLKDKIQEDKALISELTKKTKQQEFTISKLKERLENYPQEEIETIKKPKDVIKKEIEKDTFTPSEIKNFLLDEDDRF